MRNLIYTLSACLTVFFIAACATHTPYTQLQCQSQDWRKLAISDGLAGMPDTTIVKRAADCKAHGIKLDTALYTQGYVDAILHRCTERYGHLVGYTSNLPKEAACPDYRRDEFMVGYNRGVKESVADQLDPLLSKPAARAKREARVKELRESAVERSTQKQL